MCVTNTMKYRPKSLSTIADFSPSAMLWDEQEQPQLQVEVPTTTSTSKANRPPVKRRRRRRRLQKPGLTAKNNERHFVVHNYHDHANDAVDEYTNNSRSLQQNQQPRSSIVPFPEKLHAVLDQVEADGLDHIISWQPHGRCFVIHKPKDFVEQVMPVYFNQSKLTSFQRQLNLYGFQRLTSGMDAGGYYNEYFLRHRKCLSSMHMTRTKVKGTRYKAASNPDGEPNFYTMPFVTDVAVANSDSDMKTMPLPMEATSSSFSPTPLEQMYQQQQQRDIQQQARVEQKQVQEQQLQQQAGMLVSDHDDSSGDEEDNNGDDGMLLDTTFAVDWLQNDNNSNNCKNPVEREASFDVLANMMFGEDDEAKNDDSDLDGLLTSLLTEV